MKIGDLVRLKSGGPTMVVAAVPIDTNGNPTGPVQCHWFDEEDNFHSCTISPAALVPVSPSGIVIDVVMPPKP